MAETQSQQTSSNELIYRIVVFAVAGLALAGMVNMRFCYSLSLPAKPPKPDPSKVSLREVTETVQANPITYAGYLKDDSKTYQVASEATAEQMAKVLPYRVDEARHTLEPGKDSVEAAGLALTLSVRDIQGSPKKMMVLEITNLTDKPLAYQVTTVPDRGTKVCHRKQHLGHNAMVIAPGGREERSECLYRKGWKLDVTRIETIELPPLSYFYVSKVPPESVGVDTRVSRGHTPPMGSMCNVMLPATVRSGLDTGRVTWRDLIDFFARHRCDTYSFIEDYKAFSQDGERSLPVVSPK